MKQPKDIIHTFYREVLGKGNERVADTIIRDDYRQHSPTVKNGKAGFLEFLGFLKQLPPSVNPVQPFMRVIADEDLVAVHLHIGFQGQQRAVLDLYRLADNQLAEHWDASEVIPETVLTPDHVVQGPVDPGNLSDTQGNKAIVQEFVQEAILAGSEKSWTTWIHPSLIQHRPGVASGISALQGHRAEIRITQVHRIMGEGSFVVTQSEGENGTTSLVIYDIYRLAQSRIVEHWSVQQAVPTEMAHENGMI